MNLELTQEEKDLLQKLVYNEYLKQNYLVAIGKSEMPQELTSLIEKLKDDDDAEQQN